MADQIPVPTAPIADDVTVFNPSGELVQIPRVQLQDALSLGYEAANPDSAQSFLDERKFGTTSEQVKTFAESAASGATFGLSRGVERALGVDPEAMRKREEVNPGTAIAGELTGIVGSSFIPGGQGAVAAKLGEGAAARLIPAASGLAREANFIEKVGSAAVKGAIENAVIESGNEVSKLIMQDPNQSLQTAVLDVGLSGLIGAGAGGAFGAVSPLWEATVGPKARTYLNAIRDRADGELLPESEALKLIKGDLADYGVEVAPEIQAAMSKVPELQQTFNELRESGTMSGEKIRESLSKFNDDVQEQLKRTIDGGEVITAKEAGDQAKNALARDIETRNSGVRQAYDAVAPSAEIQVSEEAKDGIAKKILDASRDFGAQGSPWRNEFERWAQRIMLQEHVGHIDKLMTELGSEWSTLNRAGNFEGRKAIQEIRDIIRDGTNEVLELALPGAKDAARAARSSYADMIEHIQEISKAAGLGKVKSVGQFQEALEKIPSEKLASRLFDKNNVRALNYLKESYPEVHELLAKQMRGNILSKGTTSKGLFNPNSIFSEIDKLPDEVKRMVFPEESLGRIGAIRQVLKDVPDRLNPSGTARGLDTMWRHVPAGGLAVVGMLTGHNPIGAAILGQGGKLLARDVPDAVKLSLLKFLGSSGPVDASAWKVAADMIETTIKGQKLLDSALKAVFVGGKAVLPDALYPSEKDTEKLDKKLKEFANNPESMLDIGGKTAEYMPEHAQAMAQTTVSAVNYLNNIRPKNPQGGPLDKPMPIPQEVKQQYQRTLGIAQQPLVVLDYVKQGTVLPSDVETLQAIYPALYQKLSQGLVSEISDIMSNDSDVDYKTRIGLSMFMAQPLDSTMTPQAIQAAQLAVSQASRGETKGPPQQRGSMKALAQKPGDYLTPQQAREKSHLS